VHTSDLSYQQAEGELASIIDFHLQKSNFARIRLLTFGEQTEARIYRKQINIDRLTLDIRQHTVDIRSTHAVSSMFRNSVSSSLLLAEKVFVTQTDFFRQVHASHLTCSFIRNKVEFPSVSLSP
jgi:hypothetical protein